MALTKMINPRARWTEFKLKAAGAVSRKLYDKLTEQGVSVRDFGAKGDGVTDDTAAFQRAFSAAKGDDGNAENRLISRLLIPTPKVFYKISDTIVIDGTQGLTVVGDSARVSRNTSTDTKCAIKWFGSNSKPVFQIKGGAGVPSNPNFFIRISGLTISGTSGGPNTSDNKNGDCALAGIMVGVGGFDTKQPSVNRNCSVEDCFITSCRFGIWGGNYYNSNTDNANFSVDNCMITRNYQAGVWWGTGNAITHISNCIVFNNGWNPTSDIYSDASLKGANLYLASGYMDVTAYTSSGYFDYTPVSGDIYQNFGHLNINGAWSDTHGYFFNQSGGPDAHVGTISGVRHYEGSMNETNTPNSIRVRQPGMCIESCSIYGNIVLESGLSGTAVCTGIDFLNPKSTFTGSGVDTQHSVINIGNKGNYAQILTGGANKGVELKSKGVLTPHYLQMGTHTNGAYQTEATRQILGRRADDASVTEWYDGSQGELATIHNGFVSSNKPFTITCDKTGTVSYVSAGGEYGMTIRRKNMTAGESAELSSFDLDFRIGSKDFGRGWLKVPTTSQEDPNAPAGSILFNPATNKFRARNNTGWTDL